LPPFILSWW